MGSDQGTRHAPPDLTKDILTLMDSLHENNIYEVQPGRILDEGDMVKDVIAVGLQHLSEGTKNPLREFNNAFQGLQKRRQMKPVSTLAEEHLTQSDSEASLPHVQSVEPPSSSIPTPSNISETAPISTQVTASEADTGDMSTDSDEVEQPNELEVILDDLVYGNIEPTLPRLTEDDVALDMDEVEEVVDVESDESEWETDGEEGSGEDGGLE